MRSLIVLMLGAVSAISQTVTETRMVNAGQKKVLLKKINNRWFSPDNREVYAPGKNRMFWELDSNPGVVAFHHHRPADLRRANQLHLFQQPSEVEAILGEPNRIFGKNFWCYYALDGKKLEIRFMDGVLGEANYRSIGGETKTPLESVASDLGGRSIYKLLSERASDRIKRTYSSGSPTQSSRQAIRQTTIERVDSFVDRPAPAQRIVAQEAISAIAAGSDRTEVVAKLGEPSFRRSITSDEGSQETFTYHLEGGKPVQIRLVNGKVANP